MNFREAYRTWWANALIKDTPRDCTVVMEGVGARFDDGETNCDSPREGYLWDLDIVVLLCTFGWFGLEGGNRSCGAGW